MRVAEFVVPLAQGDADDAELIVYYFGTGAGTVDANIDRWIGQMQQPDGSSTKDKARRSTQTVNGSHVTMVDVTGTYVAEMRPGATEHYNKPGFRLRKDDGSRGRRVHGVRRLPPIRTLRRRRATFG